jgi:hypothetical protein
MTENLKTTGTVMIQVAVPPELVDIGVAPDLQRFFDAMVYKLRRNSHKGRWADVKLADAMSDLGDEVQELVAVVQFGSTAEILMEAADVANEALIVAAIALEAKDRTLTPPEPAEARSEVVDESGGSGGEQPQGHGAA